MSQVKDSVKSTSPAPIAANDIPAINATPTSPKIETLAELLAKIEVIKAREIAPKTARYNAINDEIAKLESEQEKIEHELATLGAPVKSGRGRPPMTAEQKAQAAKDRAEATALLAAKKAATAAAMTGGAINNSGAVISNTPAAVNAGA